MNAKTIKYIQDCRKKGFSDEQIRKKLLKTGYDAKRVDRFFKELEKEKISKKGFPLVPALAVILIIAILVMVWQLGWIPRRAETAYVVDLSSMDSVSEEGCYVEEEGWAFYGRCTFTKTIDIPKRLQDKPLTMVIEASGTPLYFQEMRMIDTYTFEGMSAEEFLERDWANNPGEFTLEVTQYDSSLNKTTTLIFEAGHWPEGINAHALSLFFNQTFQSFLDSSLGYDGLIVENITLNGNALIINHIAKERYDTPWPVFNASVAGEAHIIKLESGEWKIYEIPLSPQTESAVLTVQFLNDMFEPGVKADGSIDFAVKLQDRNLFIRKVLIREIEE